MMHNSPIMSKFQSNIINIYGNRGKLWLDKLPKIVRQISFKFNFCDLEEVNNLSYHYVLSGLQGTQPIILKLGLDNDALKREALALKSFAGCGVVKLLDAGHNLLILEQAVPGISLKNYFPDKDSEAAAIICNIMRKLHRAQIPENSYFPHIKDWLSALDKNWNLPSRYLQKARQIRDQLLITAAKDVFLHGDLHHDNILQNGENWIVIDPKGVIGEPAYEVAAFIRNPFPDLLNGQNMAEIIHNRINTFSNILNISKARIAGWCFVQTVLSWIWALEDGCDTEYWQELTDIFYTTEKNLSDFTSFQSQNFLFIM